MNCVVVKLIGVLLDDVQQFDDHVGLRPVGFPAAGGVVVWLVLGDVWVDPDFDLPKLGDEDHLLTYIEVPHLLV